MTKIEKTKAILLILALWSFWFWLMWFATGSIVQP